MSKVRPEVEVVGAGDGVYVPPSTDTQPLTKTNVRWVPLLAEFVTVAPGVQPHGVVLSTDLGHR